MNENIKTKVILLRATKTKKGQTILEFGFPTEGSAFAKGFSMLQSWFENNTVLFDNIAESNFGVPLEAELCYGKLYNGTAKLQLKHLFDKNGVDLLV